MMNIPQQIWWIAMIVAVFFFAQEFLAPTV